MPGHILVLGEDASVRGAAALVVERVWGYDYLGGSRLVNMAMKRLRTKPGAAPSDYGFVTTVRGLGYRFERG